jgi:hypothetical protein
MDRADFWGLIHAAIRQCRDDVWQRAAALEDALADLDAPVIESFHQHFWELMDESYRGDLWSVISFLDGGCGNDGFDYFRGWLIAQGEEVFRAVMARPGWLGPYIQWQDCAACCEAMLDVSYKAYERRTGIRDFGADRAAIHRELKGPLLSEDELRRRFPEVWYPVAQGIGKGMNIDIDEFPPGKFTLMITGADPQTYDLFDARRLQGGGHTWLQIVFSLVEMRLPAALPELDFSAEADNLCVSSSNRQLLEEVFAVVWEAVADDQLLRAAMDHAGENLE